MSILVTIKTPSVLSSVSKLLFFSKSTSPEVAINLFKLEETVPLRQSLQLRGIRKTNLLTRRKRAPFATLVGKLLNRIFIGRLFFHGLFFEAPYPIFHWAVNISLSLSLFIVIFMIYNAGFKTFFIVP